MKKVICFVFVVACLGIGAFLVYRFYLPQIVAKAIVSNEAPAYIPKRIMNRVEEMRTPINNSAEGIIRELNSREISLDEVLKAIDRISAQDVTEVVRKLNTEEPASTEQVFTIVKPYFRTDFDVELLREPFVKNFDMRAYRRAMGYANVNQTTKDADIETVRAIAKQILIQKYNEMETRKQ